jgi:hypothetical protein
MECIPSNDMTTSARLMGSPRFGHVRIRGSEGNLPERLYGEVALFSPDSRFVTLEELHDTTPFRTKLIVVELRRCKIFTMGVPPEGRMTPLRWVTQTKLLYAIDSERMEWSAP